jgi:hypothetical protein
VALQIKLGEVEMDTLVEIVLGAQRARVGVEQLVLTAQRDDGAAVGLPADALRNLDA